MPGGISFRRFRRSRVACRLITRGLVSRCPSHVITPGTVPLLGRPSRRAGSSTDSASLDPSRRYLSFTASTVSPGPSRWPGMRPLRRSPPRGGAAADPTYASRRSGEQFTARSSTGPTFRPLMSQTSDRAGTGCGAWRERDAHDGPAHNAPDRPGAVVRARSTAGHARSAAALRRGRGARRRTVRDRRRAGSRPRGRRRLVARHRLRTRPAGDGIPPARRSPVPHGPRVGRAPCVPRGAPLRRPVRRAAYADSTTRWRGSRSKAPTSRTCSRTPIRR